MNAGHSRSRIVLLRAGFVITGLAAVLLYAISRPAVRAEGNGDRLTSKPASKVSAPATVKVGEELRTKEGERRRFMLDGGVEILANQNTTLQYPERDVLKLSSGEVFVRIPAHQRHGESAVFSLLTPERQIRTGQGDLALESNARGTTVMVTRGSAKVSANGKELDVSAGQKLAADADQPAPLPRASHVLDWTKELLAASSPLVPGSKHAGGALLAVNPDGQEAKITLRKFHVDVHIEDGFARTTIDQTYFNHEPVQLEGTFYFPLPADASLSRLAMYVNGRLMEGGMVERHEARKIYDTIRYANYDPALLEWVDGTTFKMRVFPLEARTEKRIILSYTQKLPALYGQTQYRFPAGHSMQQVERWSFQARVKDGGDLAWNSPTNPSGLLKKGSDPLPTGSPRPLPGTDTLKPEKGSDPFFSSPLAARMQGNDLVLEASAKNARTDRDVVLNLTEKTPREESARFSTATQDGSQYLMVRFRPNLQIENPKSKTENRTWVFLFESSGDRNPLLARAQIEVIRHLLGQAGPEDQFVVAAGTGLRLASAKRQVLSADNIKSAIAFLEDSHLIGALDLGNALGSLQEHLQREVNPYLVHVGTGIAAMGERRTDELVKMIPPGTRYVGVGVGRRWDRGFMKAAAEATGGHFTQINPDEPIAWRAFDLAATLRTPRLMNVQVAAEDGLTEVLKDEGKTHDFAPPKFLLFNQALAQGEELCAVTRVGRLSEKGADPLSTVGKPGGLTPFRTAALPHSLRITGVLDGKAVNYGVKVPDTNPTAGHLPRTWAKLEIDRLLAENPAKNKDAVIALSKAMYVMTPFTSLLVLEHEDLYTQYRVDRGRKDHWAMYPCPVRIPVVYEPEDGQGDVRKAGERLPAKKVLERITVRGAPPLGEPGDEGRNQVYRRFKVLTPDANVNPPTVGTFKVIRPVGDLTLSFGIHQPSALPLGTTPAGTFTPDHAGTQDVQEKIQEFQPPFRGAGVAQTSIAGVDAPAFPSFEVREANLARLPLFSSIPASESRFDVKSMTMMNWTATDRLTNGLNNFNNGEMPPSMIRPMASGGVANIAFDAQYTNLLQQIKIPAVSLLYIRPQSRPEPAVFHDLLSYALGANTNLADIKAALESEALSGRESKSGKIDFGSRRLIDGVRSVGWRSLTLEIKDGESNDTIYFDGTGRYVYERVLPPGIKERVICDGKTLWHLYPQLMIGAQREVSRFHRADFAEIVPWALPTAEDLARGADLKLVDERTVAIVPFRNEQAKSPKWLEVHLIFADGKLAERQVLRMPKKEIVYRQVLAADGEIKLLDGKGKELAVRKAKLRPVEAPDLTPDTKNLVVLPLPFRTAAHVKQVLGIEKKGLGELRFKEALPLFAAEVGAGNAAGALQIFQQVYHNRDQRQLGFYVLLAACGVNLDATGADVLAEYPDEPLAQYLALHSSPVLRAHASQWAVNSVQWKDGYLQHLGLTHALLQRWQNAKVLKGSPAKVEA